MKLAGSQKDLLNNLLFDHKKNMSTLYSAGPYWDYKTKKILYWLEKKGLKDFRGLDSGVGTSYTDNIVIDIRNELGAKGRLVSKLFKFPYLNRVFSSQKKISSNLSKDLIKFKKLYYENNKKVDYLLSNYKIDRSIEFGCEDKFEYKNNEYSTLYLNMCERIDNIKQFIELNKIRSYFEIGGGFGSNIHLLINNFSNIKKIIYADIFPNLFIGTEYLRKFFGTSVTDFNTLKNFKEIKFKDDNELEILCIPPWMIKNINSSIDSFHNASSFQEMTLEQVTNYKNLIKKIVKSNSLSLIVYEGFEINKTLSPTIINKIFENKLKISEFETIDKRKLFYLF